MATQVGDEKDGSRKLRGIISCSVTPFTTDNRVDGPTFQKLVDFLIRHGSHAICVLMHVGENLNLSASEREEVAQMGVEAASGRVPVLSHTSLPGTDQVVALSQHAQSVGAWGVVVVNPYYWRSTPATLLDHFITVASALDSSLVAYNSPHALGMEIATDIMKELIERCPNFVGLKDASFDMIYFTEVCRVTEELRPEFAVFTGVEYMLPGMSLGGAGSFSVCGCVAPRLVKALYDACVAGDYERARPLQYKMSHLFDIIRVGYPAGFKAAMEIKGRPTGHVRKPRQTIDSAGFKHIEAELEKIGILSEEPHGW